MTLKASSLALRLVPSLAFALLAAHVQADPVTASRYYEDGLRRFESNDIPGAVIQLGNALQQDRSMWAAQLLLGRVHLLDGELGAAEAAFNEALRLGGNRAEVAVLLGRLYLLQGRHEYLLNNLPADGLPPAVRVEVLSMRGSAYAAMGRVADAQRSFAEARALDPRSMVPLVAEVPVLLTAGAVELARQRAFAAVALDAESAAAFNVRASVAHASGALAEALQDYERTLALDFGHFDAGVARAGILIDLGRETEARDALDALALREPREPRVAYLRALLASRRGEAPLAAALLGEAARVVDALPAAWMASQEQLLMVAALIHHAERQYEKARRYLEVLATRYPHNLGARKLLAGGYVDSADFPRALSLLEHVLRDQPGDPQALQLLGRIHLAQKRYGRAVALLERAVAGAGKAQGLDLALGFAYLGLENRTAALPHLRAAFEQRPADPTLALTLANLLMREGRRDEALEIANRLVGHDPESVQALNLQGLIRSAAGDRVGARAAYDAALLKQPAFAAVVFNQARLDAADGKPDDARARLNAVLLKNRTDARVMYEYARLEQSQGRFADALRWIEKAAAERVTDLEIGLALADIRAANGDLAGAREAARALAVRRPGDMNALAALARAELGVGDLPSARQTLREMTRRADFDGRLLVRIGYLQLAAANHDGAEYAAQKALQGRADDPAALVLAVEAALAARDLDRAGAALRTLRTKHPESLHGPRLAGELARGRKASDGAEEPDRQTFVRAPSHEQPGASSSTVYSTSMGYWMASGIVIAGETPKQGEQIGMRSGYEAALLRFNDDHVRLDAGSAGWTHDDADLLALAHADATLVSGSLDGAVHSALLSNGWSLLGQHGAGAKALGRIDGFNSSSWLIGAGWISTSDSGGRSRYHDYLKITSAAGAAKSPPGASVPEPGSLALAGLGLLGLIGLRRRTHRG